jgi:hypothetical protein
MEQTTSTGVAPVLDIGGDIGALVVQLAAVPVTGELEACPAGRPDARFHTGVHERRVGDRVVAVAVYPALHAGAYEILDERLAPVARSLVTGGEVSELRLA